jgi:hypothetical protein
MAPTSCKPTQRQELSQPPSPYAAEAGAAGVRVPGRPIPPSFMQDTALRRCVPGAWEELTLCPSAGLKKALAPWLRPQGPSSTLDSLGPPALPALTLQLVMWRRGHSLLPSHLYGAPFLSSFLAQLMPTLPQTGFKNHLDQPGRILVPTQYLIGSQCTCPNSLSEL